jgi:hypothetical protein
MRGGRIVLIVAAIATLMGFGMALVMKHQSLAKKQHAASPR